MSRAQVWLTRSLATGHLAWGLLLIVLAGHGTRSAFAVLAYMSSGTVWTNLPLVRLFAVEQAVPLALLGAWMLILALRLWSGERAVRTALLVTHGILLVPGVLALGIGILAIRAAAASAAKGGGLLGAWGFIPLGIGVCIVALALPSVVLAVTGVVNAPESTER